MKNSNGLIHFKDFSSYSK